MITILIDQHSDVPLYQQITGQIRTQVMSGAINGGTQLPSIRQLAKDLTVSIITTKRAYEDLEREGILRTIAGRGSFICEHPPELVSQMRCDEIRAALDTVALRAKEAGMPREEFLSLAGRSYEED